MYIIYSPITILLLLIMIAMGDKKGSSLSLVPAHVTAGASRRVVDVIVKVRHLPKRS